MSDEDRLKAIIRNAMKAHGYDTIRTQRHDNGRWLASVHGNDDASFLIVANHKCETDAPVALAKKIGAELP